MAGLKSILTGLTLKLAGITMIPTGLTSVLAGLRSILAGLSQPGRPNWFKVLSEMEFSRYNWVSRMLEQAE
jgi:hypothetical protein